jgi:hypothetical protein
VCCAFGTRRKSVQHELSVPDRSVYPSESEMSSWGPVLTALMFPPLTSCRYPQGSTHDLANGCFAELANLRLAFASQILAAFQKM